MSATDAAAPSWWDEDRRLALENPDGEETPLSEEIIALLDEVDALFRASCISAELDPQGWPDPHLDLHGRYRDSTDDEYSRCLDPEKFRLLHVRADAWRQVLLGRGWADEETAKAEAGEDVEEHAGAVSPVAWAGSHSDRPADTVLLRPRRAGARTLVLTSVGGSRDAARTRREPADLSSSDEVLPALIVGVGAGGPPSDAPMPAIAVEDLPDCGCDACDSGSRDLLEQVDRAILSIVDGSLEAAVGPDGYRRRTSFGAEAGSGGEPDEAVRPLEILAGPWAPDWTPRPLTAPITDLDGPSLEDWQRESWQRESWPREPWPLRALGAVAGALPVPLARRLGGPWPDGLRSGPGRSGRAASVRYRERP
ncbi:DUF6226 family protein [Brachybacterium sp. DNPG3]